MSLRAILDEISREKAAHRTRVTQLRRAFGTAAYDRLRLHRMTSGDVAKAINSAVSNVSNVLHGHGWSGHVARAITDVLEPPRTCAGFNEGGDDGR